MESNRRYPRRESAARAMENIRAIREWETCREDSEQFKQIAELLNQQFESESKSGCVKTDENETVDIAGQISETEIESEEDEDEYESSFIDDDSIASLSEDEGEEEEFDDESTTSEESIDFGDEANDDNDCDVTPKRQRTSEPDNDEGASSENVQDVPTETGMQSLNDFE